METQTLKTNKAIRRAIAAVAGASALLMAGAAQAALQDRDLNGDTVADAFYDTDLNITWLRNANVNGPMNWDTAVAWAAGFSFGGYHDWRLPTTLQPDSACDVFLDAGPPWGVQGYGNNCTGSEMGHLWYVELGNTGGLWRTSSGSFQNMEFASYWSGTEYAPDTTSAWFFTTSYGTQLADGKSSDAGGPFFAMAVRDGDVAVVPEPQTYALLLAGLTALALARRQRPR